MEFADYVVDDELLAQLLEEPGTLQSERWLLVGITGTALAEKSWVDAAEVDEASFRTLLHARAPEPNLNEGCDYRTLAPESRDALPTRCRACAVTPGWTLCSICGGEGSIRIGQDDSMACSGCDRQGRFPCSACNGTRRSYDVRIVYHNARPASFAHVFVPKEVAWLRTLAFEFMKRQAEIPECLAIDLSESFGAKDAYRGTSGVPMREGHRFGSALEDARHYLERIAKAPSVLASRHRALAWPMVIVPHRRAAFARNGDGSPARL